jgi:hypothetical protein
MHDRPTEYAQCTRALVADRNREGASGIFDNAVTNGLAAIVAARWPGNEQDARARIKPASGLLDVIKANATPNPNAIYELPDLDPPPQVEVFGPPLDPSPTLVNVDVLTDGIKRMQVIRHARNAPAEPLEEEHISALVALNEDAALRVSLTEDVDEYEERVTLADAVERSRARAYLELLSVEEFERRAEVDYAEEYLEIEDGERYHTAHECPVCGLEALIENARDSYLDEFPAGTCVACSYVKSYDIADLEGRDEAIDRAVRDPNR